MSEYTSEMNRKSQTNQNIAVNQAKIQNILTPIKERMEIYILKKKKKRKSVVIFQMKMINLISSENFASLYISFYQYRIVFHQRVFGFCSTCMELKPWKIFSNQHIHKCILSACFHQSS